MQLVCQHCGEPFEAKRKTAKFCTDAHRMADKRKPPAAVVSLVPPPPPDESRETFAASVEAATRQALEDAGRLATPLGQAALILSQKLDHGLLEPGAGIAAVAKQLEATLASALKGAGEESDAVDKILESAALKLIRTGSG